REEPAALPFACLAGRHSVHSRVRLRIGRQIHPAARALDRAVSRYERIEPAQPETGSLRLPITELPRLHRLRELAIVGDAGLRVPVHDRVLDRDTRDRRVPHGGEQVGAFIQLAPHIFARAPRRRRREPPHAAVAEPGTRRVRDAEQVPAPEHDFARITDDMAIAAILGHAQVAGPGIVAEALECTADGAGELAGDQDAEGRRELHLPCPSPPAESALRFAVISPSISFATSSSYAARALIQL